MRTWILRVMVASSMVLGLGSVASPAEAAGCCAVAFEAYPGTYGYAYTSSNCTTGGTLMNTTSRFVTGRHSIKTWAYSRITWTSGGIQRESYIPSNQCRYIGYDVSWETFDPR